MPTASHLVQVDQPVTAAAQSAGCSGGAGRILMGVFQLFDRSAIPYCALHGYEDYPHLIKSDVDCVIASAVTPSQLYSLLHRNSATLGADVVRCTGYYLILAGRNADGSRCFLTLDFTAGCELDGVLFYSGNEVLDCRRRHDQFWIPAPHVEFGCYLARSIAKGNLDKERTRKLSSLYQQDPAGCEAQVGRFWGGQNGTMITSAVRSGDWQQVHHGLGRLQAELRRRAILRSPGRFASHTLHGFINKLSRIRHPQGLNVVLLGPDGAGKSSVIAALSRVLDGAFTYFTCWGFAPPLHRLVDRRRHPTDQPHALPPRSWLVSVVRAGYWFVYYTLGYVVLRLVVARSTLVLNDRHYVDILVDAKRYRYGGPSWLTRLIWRMIPKPDLVILLDAPPEVFRSRKQEVTLEETVRQRMAYQSLVRTMANAYTVDASQPLDKVVSDVSEIVLSQLSMRVARRFGHHAEIS